MALRIRRGRREDYDALAALGGWPGVAGREARSVRLYKRVIADLAHDLYVAEEDGLLVGVVSVSYIRSLPLGGQRAILDQLQVRADSRRKGIGRALLEFVGRRATRRGARAFETVARDAEAERFLEHVGFEPTGRGWGKTGSDNVSENAR